MKCLRESVGFTFIEVLVGIAILSFGLIGLASMTTSLISGNTYSENLTSAISLAEAKIEELMYYTAGGDGEWGTSDDYTHAQVLNNNALANWVDANNDGISEADGDNDGIPDFYDKDAVPDHSNGDGPNEIANPIDIITSNQGIFNRVWNVADIDSDGDGRNDLKLIAVIVYWIDGLGNHSIVLTSKIS